MEPPAVILATGEVEAALTLLESAYKRLLADKAILPFLHFSVAASIAATRQALAGIRMARDSNLGAYVGRINPP